MKYLATVHPHRLMTTGKLLAWKPNPLLNLKGSHRYNSNYYNSNYYNSLKYSVLYSISITMYLISISVTGMINKLIQDILSFSNECNLTIILFLKWKWQLLLEILEIYINFNLFNIKLFQHASMDTVLCQFISCTILQISKQNHYARDYNAWLFLNFDMNMHSFQTIWVRFSARMKYFACSYAYTFKKIKVYTFQ